MSDSTLAVYTAISPNCNSPRNKPITKITVHHMAGNATLEGFGVLVSRPSRQMSANYAIESSGRIGLFCHEADRSWCSSSPWNDQRAITIEVANDSGAPDWHVWVLCIVFTLLWARIAAVFANKADAKTLNRATGIILVILGVVVMGFNWLS